MPPLAIALILTPLLLLPFLWLLLQSRNHVNRGPRLPPGPRPLPIIGNLHMLGRLPHRALAKLAQKHGPIMSLRLGKVPTIVVSSPQAAELFLKQHDPVFASRPIIQASVYLSYGTKGLGFCPYGDYWRRVRKMCTLHLLTAAKVEGFEWLRKRETEAAMRRLKRVAAAREVVDVEKMVGEVIEEIMLMMVVGKGRKEEKRFDLMAVAQEILVLEGAFNVADFVPCLAYLDLQKIVETFSLQGFTRRMKATSKVADDILESIIEDHLKKEDFGQQMDILDGMLALINNPDGEFLSFNRDNVKAIMLDLFVAGIDTSTVTITWALASLLKNPRVMTTLQDELDAIIGRARMVTESDLPKLSYLDMVIKETFRLYPVAPLLLPHESIEDVVINEYIIPKKTRIIVNFWGIGHDPNVWSDNVEEFLPERFLNTDIDVRGHDFELIPFGAGRRGCPGMHLGLITVKLILAQLVHCFDWKLPDDMQPEDVDMTEKFGLAMPKAIKLVAIPSYRLQFTI